MTTVRPSGLSGLFPASSGSYMEANAGYFGVTEDDYRSVSLWVKVPPASGIPDQSTTGSLVYWGSNSSAGGQSGRAWSIELKNGKPRLWVRNAHMTADAVKDPRCVVDDGEWHLITWQFQEGTNIEDVELYIDDFGPVDTTVFGVGTGIFTSVTSAPYTFGARNLGPGPHYFIERDYQLDHVAVWRGKLESKDVAFLWNRGHDGGTGLGTTGTDGQPDQGFSPAALSGTIELESWHTFNVPYEWTDEIFDSTAEVGKSMDVFNGATWVHDTPASGIFG